MLGATYRPRNGDNDKGRRAKLHSLYRGFRSPRRGLRPQAGVAIVVAVRLLLFTASTVVTSLLGRQARQDQLSQLTSDAGLTSDYVAASLSGLPDVVHAWSGRSQVRAVAESSRSGVVPAAEFADALRLTQSLRMARAGVATAFIVDASGRCLATAPLNRYRHAA